MPDGLIPGGPAFVGTPAAPVEPVGAPASADGFLSVPGGPGFAGQPQPPDVPCDPTGEDWRGPPLTQVAQALAALLVDLRTHGMIGT